MADTTAVSTANANMKDYPFVLQAEAADPAIVYSAADFRSIVHAVFNTEGPLDMVDLGCYQRAAGANYSVDVGVGRAIIQGDVQASQGKYLVESLGTVNIATPNNTAGRHHLLVAEILDGQVAGAVYGWQLRMVEDTGAGRPATPINSIPLAEVTVGASSVQTSNLVDLRQCVAAWFLPRDVVFNAPNRPAENYVANAVTNYVGAVTPYMKRFTYSQLNVTVDTSGFTANAPAQILMGVTVNGVNSQLRTFYLNTNNEHHSFSGTANVGAGLVNGVYTVQVWFWLLTSNPNSFRMDANDSVTIRVSETQL